MKIIKKSLVFLLVIMMLVCACDSENGTDNVTVPDSQPIPGKITAIASGINGQDGKGIMVGAFDYDWSPGSSDLGMAGYMAEITGDNFLSSDVLRIFDDQGKATDDEMIFDPGTYSIVFIIFSGGPPEYLAEVRVEVDGDVEAVAPSWSKWNKL